MAPSPNSRQDCPVISVVLTPGLVAVRVHLLRGESGQGWCLKTLSERTARRSASRFQKPPELILPWSLEDVLLPRLSADDAKSVGDLADDGTFDPFRG